MYLCIDSDANDYSNCMNLVTRRCGCVLLPWIPSSKTDRSVNGPLTAAIFHPSSPLASCRAGHENRIARVLSSDLSGARPIVWCSVCSPDGEAPCGIKRS